MKKLSTLLALFLLFSVAQAELLDKVVARVNNEAITLSEIDEEIANLRDDMTRNMPPEKVTTELARRRPAVINTLIEYRLMLQKAKQLNISFDEKELNERLAVAIESTKERFPTPDDYLMELEKKGLTEDDLRDKYHRMISEQMIFSRLNNREVRSKVKISDQQIESFFSDMEYVCKVEHIFIGINQIHTPQILKSFRKKAEELRAQAAKAKDFNAFAKEHSNSARILVGGEDGYFRRGDLIPEVEDVAYKLAVGQVSAVIASPSGFHIIKLIDKKKQPLMMSVHARHILLKDEKQAADIRQKILDGADFAEMATNHSVGPTAVRGGDLGFFKKGDMVPAFDQAVFALKPGEISPVVQTKFGFHIIKLEEVQALDLIKKRKEIKEILFEREVKHLSFVWLNNLKLNAKVELLIENTPIKPRIK